MALDPRTPVIVGVGQVNDPGRDAPEPVALLTEAAVLAAGDAKADRLLRAVDSIRVIRLLSWRYRDPAALLAPAVGAAPRHTAYTTDGGHTPQLVVNGAAEDIRAGRADVVLVGGAESWRTRMAHRQRGERPDWTRQPDEVSPTEVLGTDLAMSHPVETELGVIMPVQVYPMFESALRHQSGRSVSEHTARIAELWAGFSVVAAANPYAAVPRALTAGEIATPSPTNRVIGAPYTKLLNSNNSVNQAAALLLCSFEQAEAAGVSRERMVFPWCGSEANDTQYVSNRADLHSSPAIRMAGEALLRAAGCGIDDIAHVDLYSCFPSAVQVAAAELGIDPARPLTVTGGLTFAGGPWNNYVTHGIATMVDVLRDDPGALGLCTANGGLLTKHALGLYGTEPPPTEFRVERPETGRGATREVAPLDVTGSAAIEAYTVMHDAEGRPERAIVTALLSDGRRAWRTSEEPALLTAMLRDDLVGRPIVLAAGDRLEVA